MDNRSRRYDDRGSGREPGTSARQVAEALFAPKPQRVEPSDPAKKPASGAVRKPRVLAVAAPAVPIPRDEPESARAKPLGQPVIPAAHVARVRAWLKYGMTAAQVAETYGVAIGEVERILRTA